MAAKSIDRAGGPSFVTQATVEPTTADHTVGTIEDPAEVAQWKGRDRGVIGSGTAAVKPSGQSSDIGRSGGRIIDDCFDWLSDGKYKNVAEVEEARRRVINGPVDGVRRSLALGGVTVDSNQLRAVQRYLFDSGGIRFARDNYEAWTRLANGNALVKDVQFLVHELDEVKTLQQIQQQTGFDFMGKNLDSMSTTDARHWRHRFSLHYEAAHAKALEAEYKYVAKQVSQAIGASGRPISHLVAAVNDTTRDEALNYMLEGGRNLSQHPHFEQWSERGSEKVPITKRARERLRILADQPAISELIRAVRHSRLPE